ncbi:hypothetical protein [Novosphingobium sp. B 225]|uniref:hypothetical protein n=1 Tax=Novosphingobium sp. B 225 TaxID=1961849 RepID=UPI001124EBD1|nr:hypothetical protein [Novosphingobium sp. B 225]
MAITDFSDRRWVMEGAANAYVQNRQTWSLDLVGMLSGRIACGLLALGLPKGTKVAANCYQPVAAHAAATAHLRNRGR